MRWNGIILLSGNKKCHTTSEVIKLLLCNSSLIFNVSTICLTVIGKYLKCSQHTKVANRKRLHSAIVILVDEAIPCWLVESEDIHNIMDTPSIQGLGQQTVLSLLEDNCHHMLQHSLAIGRRVSTLSCNQHGRSKIQHLSEDPKSSNYYT